MSQSSPGKRLYDSIRMARSRLVAGVPDGMLAETIRLCMDDPQLVYADCAREEECIGVACGAALAGERAVVLVQNAGFLNSIGAFATMALRYQLPIVILVTNRGGLADPNGYDIEKRLAFDGGVRPIATVFDFSAAALPDDLIPAAFSWAEAGRRPVVLAIEKSLGEGASQ